jgi:hypothetical protein
MSTRSAVAEAPICVLRTSPPPLHVTNVRSRVDEWTVAWFAPGGSPTRRPEAGWVSHTKSARRSCRTMICVSKAGKWRGPLAYSEQVHHVPRLPVDSDKAAAARSLPCSKKRQQGGTQNVRKHTAGLPFGRFHLWPRKHPNPITPLRCSRESYQSTTKENKPKGRKKDSFANLPGLAQSKRRPGNPGLWASIIIRPHSGSKKGRPPAKPRSPCNVLRASPPEPAQPHTPTCTRPHLLSLGPF